MKTGITKTSRTKKFSRCSLLWIWTRLLMLMVPTNLVSSELTCSRVEYSVKICSTQTYLMIQHPTSKDGSKDTLILGQRRLLKPPQTASSECNWKKLIPTRTKHALSMLPAMTLLSPTPPAGFRESGIPTMMMSMVTDTTFSSTLSKRSSRWKNGELVTSGRPARLPLWDGASCAVNTLTLKFLGSLGEYIIIFSDYLA